MMNNLAKVRVEAICQDWHELHQKLLTETNKQKKQHLIYQEMVLERRFSQLLSQVCVRKEIKR